MELDGLTVRVHDRVLLRDVRTRFAAGRVSLIIGCSGAGKSVLLRTLAGLLSPSDSAIRVSGQVRMGDADRRAGTDGQVGIVFQNFALFDEFTPMENVRFAQAHSRSRGTADPASLLAQLEVPRATPTSALSGGQKQRLAIARTLAFDPDVILYDEPTSGLDVVTARRVAGLIGATHDRFPRTSIIVTHDYESLPEIADDVYLLDPAAQTLVQVPRSEWARLPELLHAPPVEKPATVAQPAWRRLLQQGGSSLADFFEASTHAALVTLRLPLNLLPRWRSPVWGLRYLAHYLRLVAGPSAWVYVAVAGMIIGFVSTYFTFRFLPYANYTEPLLIENLLHSMGFALYRILVPVLTTILVAARSGAAVASDTGGKSYGNQLAAMRTLNAAPDRYLLTTVLWAFLLGTPLLLALSYVVAAATSLVAFVATHPQQGSLFWDMHFHRELRTPGAAVYAGTGWLLAKTLACAAGTGLVCYYRGVRPKRSARDVSHGITSAILWATLWVLIVHFAFSFIEF